MDKNSFGDTAKGLSKNPLGIIALFIVLVYGFAAMVTGFGAQSIKDLGAHPLIWFLTGFPVLVLVLFAWLVAKHHGKLYGPRDYREDKTFLSTVKKNKPELLTLPFAAQEDVALVAPPESIGPEHVPRRETPKTTIAGTRSISLDQVRAEIYKENRNIFLAHVLAPSDEPGQAFDIYIFLVGHKDADLKAVQKAEFFFGRHWGNRIFLGIKSDDTIGVRTAAYGSFLCTCRITFEDGETTTTYRYIDFEMGSLVRRS